MTTCKRIALTTGEPAGIGPDLAILLAQKSTHLNHNCEIITLACPELIKQRALQLHLTVQLEEFNLNQPASPNKPGTIKIYTIPTTTAVSVGQLNTKNASYVLSLLDTAINGCQQGIFDAMVTAPIQKSVINDAGFIFSGHTEYLANKTQTDKVVMMLATEELRVALATTHLPLREVADAITGDLLKQVINILHTDLQRYFNLQNPRILISGLNPHAGENGHMGSEEIKTIIPCIQELQRAKIQLEGPLPADTLFTKKYLDRADAVLAMYHDQGLPVLKYQGFGRAANITLGLPIIRTSVDHGTALDLAGTGNIDCGSLITAINIAHHMAS